MVGRAGFAALILVLLTGCGATEPPAEHRTDLADLLPPVSELAGWTIAEGPVTHTPENLFEYLNGGADRYLSHGFVQLLHIRYQLGDDVLSCVTLDVYDMGGVLGAFGIYSAARTPVVEPRRWGAEGYRSGPIAAAWKGEVFVHGEADDEDPQLVELLERLVAGVCDRAPGDASMPTALDPLPAGNRVARSERYVPADLLGHSFLPGGVLATYELDGLQAELYYSDLGSESAAMEALEALRAHLSRRGNVEGRMAAIGADGFRYTDPTAGAGTVVRMGGFVAGIHGQLSAEARETVLADLVAAMG